MGTPLLVTYRGHRSGDAVRLADLTAVAMPRDAISADWFTHTVLLDPNFDPDGLIVAVDADTDDVLGFVYAVRAGRGIGPDPDGGWITIGCVDPHARRQGIGTELLRRAKSFLAGKGAKWINYAAYPLAYFVPGLDAQAYPEAAALFEKNGFQKLYTAAAMSINLSEYAMPEEVRELRATRVAEGYSFAAAGPDDLPETLSFASQRLAPDWGEAVRDSVLQNGRIDRVIVARHPDGQMVGFATYGAYRGLRERFGPYGVDESCRGTGLGKVLLHDTLTRMRAEGAQSAWFLWTGEESPAGHLYLRSGFHITRRFDVLRADLGH
ncbi:GNAT family N-acetyltransferase [Microbacterium sp. A93]|uniref:GNAT family N-acetyltransferase n=1 Tax=Microbacterium sp. A93 TaxID=3450716 RepID=UPI003F43E608